MEQDELEENQIINKDQEVTEILNQIKRERQEADEAYENIQFVEEEELQIEGGDHSDFCFRIEKYIVQMLNKRENGFELFVHGVVKEETRRRKTNEVGIREGFDILLQRIKTLEDRIETLEKKKK
jgi:hypothetical protein